MAGTLDIRAAHSCSMELSEGYPAAQLPHTPANERTHVIYYSLWPPGITKHSQKKQLTHPGYLVFYIAIIPSFLQFLVSYCDVKRLIASFFYKCVRMEHLVGRPNQDLCIIKGENLCVTGPNETMCNFHP